MCAHSLVTREMRKTNYNLHGYIFLYLFLERFCFLIASLHGSNNPFGILYKRGIKLHVKHLYINDIFWQLTEN